MSNLVLLKFEGRGEGRDEIREVNRNQIIILGAIFEAPTPRQATNLSILHI